MIPLLVLTPEGNVTLWILIGVVVMMLLEATGVGCAAVCTETL